MRPSTLVRLALAGTRTDAARVVLTGFSACLAALGFLAALTVIAIPTVLNDNNNTSPQYRNALIAEPGLRPGVVFALVLLTVPVLALAGQCARLGAPARDRRLSAIRLAGATPGQAVTIAATETGVASALGALAGLGVYFGGRELLHRPGADGTLPLPTDVLPPSWVLAAVCAGIPVLSALVTAVLLRRVAVTPLGVVRRVRTNRPKPWPGVLIALGIGTMAVILPLQRRYENLPGEAFLLLVLFALLAATAGAVLGTAWISYGTGQLLHRFARRPAALLAARRLMADPWNGSRTMAALLGCLVFAAGAAGVREGFATDFALQDEMNRRSAEAEGATFSGPQDTDFYFRAFDLTTVAITVGLVIAAGGLVVALAESIVSRRRAYAALVATGVPRGTLARAVAWQTLAPAVPGVLIALMTGAGLARGLFSDVRANDYSPCGSGDCEPPEVVRAVPVPLDDLALYGAGALAALLAVVGVGLLFLRASTAVEELRV
ncbi:FtsX-like permease family protein [Actinomycetes bacterium KLBMP 9797]